MYIYANIFLQHFQSLYFLPYKTEIYRSIYVNEMILTYKTKMYICFLPYKTEIYIYVNEFM